METLIFISPSQIASETETLPAETESSRELVDIFLIFILPVLVLILINSEAEAEKLTLPVVKEISTFSN